MSAPNSFDLNGYDASLRPGTTLRLVILGRSCNETYHDQRRRRENPPGNYQVPDTTPPEQRRDWMTSDVTVQI